MNEAFEEYLKKVDYHYTSRVSMLRHKEIFSAGYVAGWNGRAQDEGEPDA